MIGLGVGVRARAGKEFGGAQLLGTFGCRKEALFTPTFGAKYEDLTPKVAESNLPPEYQT